MAILTGKTPLETHIACQRLELGAMVCVHLQSQEPG